MIIRCQKVVQNNVEFLLGKLTSTQLSRIVTVTQRIILSFDETGMPIYNKQLQRKPNITRVNAIKDYLLIDETATFPNSILVAVPSMIIASEIVDNDGVFDLLIDVNRVDLNSKESPIYVQIIDGQHRFRGMQVAIESLKESGDNDDLLGRLESFEFVVSFFIEPEIDFQAMLFSTINRTPVKVSQDIVYDLFGVLENDSPQKTALAICLELNGHKKENSPSPFYKRIKLLGKKEKGENSYISQSMFIKTILLLICPNLRIAEIERFKDRSYFKTGGTHKTIFRQFYANGKDNYIFKTVDNFFTAVREVFVDSAGKSYWDIGQTVDNPLQKTIGFLAMIDILIELFHIGMAEKRLNTEFFKLWLSKAKEIRLLGETGESNYPYTSSGKTKLSSDLIELIFDRA